VGVALSAVPEPDLSVLRDPHRIAAARRLIVEVPGPAAFDRLSSLAARLVGAGHAKVTLFTDQDTVVGGFGLPPGVVGGPALLTGALSEIVVRSARGLALPDATQDERVAGLPAVTTGQVRSYLGAPLVAASGHVVGALAVYDERVQDWTDDAVELLAQLAASVVAELELSAVRSAAGRYSARLDIALEASSVGIWEVDLREQVIDWDQRCAAIFGYDDAVRLPLDRLFTDHVHPDDRESAGEAMSRAIEARAQYTVELRVMRADGGTRWTVSRGRVLVDTHGEPVRILGTVVDLTEAREQSQRRLAAVHRAAAIAEVAAELANATRLDQLADVALRGAQVLGAESSALAVFGPDGPLRLHMTSRLVDAVRSGTDIELPPGGVEIALDDSLPTQYAARHGRRVLLADRDEAEARFPDMAQVHAILGTGALAALPLRVEGHVLGSFVAVWAEEHRFVGDDLEVLDALTAQIALTVSRLQADSERAAAVAAMTEANRQLQLLADAGRVLSGTLEINQQLEQLTALVVPGLADWCWVVVADEQTGKLTDVSATHRDPRRQAELERYVRQMVVSMTEEAGARVVLRTGRPVVVPEVDWDRLELSLPDAGARDTLARFDLGSSLFVPLVAQGECLGALGLFNGTERGPHSDAEVDTAVEIGRRAGLALHHARLYGQQRALADALQRSMLTAPPQPDHCEIVVRYVPAAEGAEIGGDWYDAFLQPAGAIMLAIGDVVGHDTRAAAAMGQVRGLLRGISYARNGSPAEVLTQLDRAVQGLALETMATALVARLERDDPRQDEARRDTRLRDDQVLLRWASAGHPPPVVVAPDGTVSVLDGAPADLLLGVEPESHREDRAVVLDRGCTVLLYTDGLVERRDRDIDAGTDELVTVLGECGGLSLDQLCDRVLERMFLPDAEDDVALLAVRLHPED
jgi:PAS domain S-box-containing protein